MKYELCFVVVSEDGSDKLNAGYEVRFTYDPEQYGNGTYMSCISHDRTICSNRYFDIRYDRDYSKDQQMLFIAEWVLNTWTGKNGSYRATEISIKEMPDE